MSHRRNAPLIAMALMLAWVPYAPAAPAGSPGLDILGVVGESVDREAPPGPDRQAPAARPWWESALSFGGNFVAGIGVGAWSLVKGTVDLGIGLVTDPLRTLGGMAQGIAAVLSDPSILADAAGDYWQRLKWAAANDPDQLARMLGEATFNIASVAVGGYGAIRGAASVARGLRAARAARGASVASRTGAVVARAGRGVPGGPRVTVNRGHLPVIQRLCFVAGTLILTETGLVPIERIAVHTPAGGTRVLSRGDRLGPSDPVSVRPVVEVYRRRADHLRILTLRAPDGRPERLRTTDNHPFQLLDRGWVEAAWLVPGDRLATRDGRQAILQSTRREAHPDGVEVFNFQVAEDHTYFVGRSSLWVHNQNGCNLTRLSPDDLAALRRAGVDPADLLKGRGRVQNLFRDADGHVVIADASGTGNSVSTGVRFDPGGSATTSGARPADLSPPGAGRRGAFREAKRRAGVPVGQQPTRVLSNVDRRGGPQPGRIYEFEVQAPGGGKRVIRIRDDAGGHSYGPGDPQNRGPHFNDPEGGHFDY